MLRKLFVGWSIFCSWKPGNGTPSTEANLSSEAANIVFMYAVICVVGLNITTQVNFTDKDLLELRKSNGKYAWFLCNAEQECTPMSSRGGCWCWPAGALAFNMVMKVGR